MSGNPNTPKWAQAIEVPDVLEPPFPPPAKTKR